MARGKKRIDAPRSWRVKKGDEVIVLTGRDKGRKGEILKVLRDEGRVLVSGINMIKRHQRPTPSSPGGIDEREAPIHVSNVALADPKSGAPTRVGFKVMADGKKARVARRSGEVID